MDQETITKIANIAEDVAKLSTTLERVVATQVAMMEKLNLHDEALARLIPDSQATRGTTPTTEAAAKPAGNKSGGDNVSFQLGLEGSAGTPLIDTPPKKPTGVSNVTHGPMTLAKELENLGATGMLTSTKSPSGQAPARSSTGFALSADDDESMRYPSLRKQEQFKCSDAEKLSFPVEVQHILAMEKKMAEHYSSTGDTVKWRQCCKHELKLHIARKFLKMGVAAFHDMKEEFVYKSLVVLAAPRTKEDFNDELKKYKPTSSFLEQRINLYLFSDEVSVHINTHIEGFLELLELLMHNDRTQCPHAFQPEKGPGGNIIRESLVYLFLASFPHDMGKILHKLFEIKTTTTFEQYVKDFTAGVDRLSLASESTRAFQRSISEINVKKKGSTKEQVSKSTRLYALDDDWFEEQGYNSRQEIPLIVPTQDSTSGSRSKESVTDLYQLMEKPRAVLTPAEKKKLGCFNMAQKNECKLGNSCPYSHARADIEVSHKFLKDRNRRKAEELDNSKYKSGGRVPTSRAADHVRALEEEQPAERSEKRLFSVDTNVRCAEDDSDSDNLPESYY
jgi:hypothetical protein